MFKPGDKVVAIKNHKNWVIDLAIGKKYTVYSCYTGKAEIHGEEVVVPIIYLEELPQAWFTVEQFSKRNLPDWF